MTLAHTDPLTELLNRRGFDSEAAYRQQAAETAGASLTMCYLDLDGFKSVNDTHGHEAGDEVLRQVAQRLQSAVRSFDLVARIGGDEFVILAGGLEDGHVETFFNRVLTALNPPYEIGRHSVSLGVSLGVAVGWLNVETALQAADEAMYRAKQRGGGVEIKRVAHTK